MKKIAGLFILLLPYLSFADDSQSFADDSQSTAAEANPIAAMNHQQPLPLEDLRLFAEVFHPFMYLHR